MTCPHGARRKHVRQWNLTFLFQEIRHVLCAFCAQLLIESGAADLRGISLNLNDVAGNAHGLLGEFQELRFVLGVNGDLVVAQDRDLTQDIVVTQFSEALVGSGNGGFVGGIFACSA